MAYKLMCGKFDNDGNESNTKEIVEKEFTVNGYSVGDRLLEGVLFHIKFNENGDVLSVIVDDDANVYFDNLNAEKWYKEVIKYAEQEIKMCEIVDVPKHIKEKYNVEEDSAYITTDCKDEKPPIPTVKPITINKTKLF